MPRYYFSARGPNRHIPDYDGLELSDILMARAVALAAAADVLRGNCNPVTVGCRWGDRRGHTYFARVLTNFS